MKNRLRLLMLSFFVSCAFMWAAVQTIPYGYAGNHKGLLYYPEESPEYMGVVIYNYDEYIERNSMETAYELGYDIPTLASLLNQLGYMLFVPLNRAQRIGPIQGAVFAMMRHPRVDNDRIHLMGIGEGATLSLMATPGIENVKSLTIAAPTALFATGISSIPALVRNIDSVTMPVFLAVPIADKSWRIDFGRELKDVLVNRGKTVIYKEYIVRKRWFWYPRTEFTYQVFDFIRQVDGVIPVPKKAPEQSQDKPNNLLG